MLLYYLIVRLQQCLVVEIVVDERLHIRAGKAWYIVCRDITQIKLAIILIIPWLLLNRLRNGRKLLVHLQLSDILLWPALLQSHKGFHSLLQLGLRPTVSNHLGGQSHSKLSSCLALFPLVLVPFPLRDASPFLLFANARGALV